MSTISTIAASALQAAGTATAVRATNIVNATTPGFTAQAPVYGGSVNGGIAAFTQDTNAPTNLLTETVGLIGSTQQYKAAAKLLATDDEMRKTLLKAFV